MIWSESLVSWLSWLLTSCESYISFDSRRNVEVLGRSEAFFGESKLKSLPAASMLLRLLSPNFTLCKENVKRSSTKPSKTIDKDFFLRSDIIGPTSWNYSLRFLPRVFASKTQIQTMSGIRLVCSQQERYSLWSFFKLLKLLWRSLTPSKNVCPQDTWQEN